MSTGKRIAKRSILGTRVCAPRQDGLYYSGVIKAVGGSGTYTVTFDERLGSSGSGGSGKVAEYRECDIVGPGFQSVSRVKLKPGQKVYVTYNGREVSGAVVYHRPQIDEVVIHVVSGGTFEMKRKIEDVRLVESRKCARLQGQDTDFARLADIGLTATTTNFTSTDATITSGNGNGRKRATSNTIDVPSNQHWNRKRRPSSPELDVVVDAAAADTMNDCTAALVLMSLSCSPKSPRLPNYVSSDTSNQFWTGPHSWTSSSSGASSWDNGPDKSPPQYQGAGRSTPSPPSPSIERLSESAPSFVPTESMFLESNDEGIEMDEDTTKKVNTKTVFKCTWPGCNKTYALCESIERHVREQHLGKNEKHMTDGEEEFYYTELEVSIDTLTESFPNICASSPPTLSHMDMARPPYEDPIYQKSLQMKYSSQPISIPHQTGSSAQSSPGKQIKSKSYSHILSSPKSSSHKGSRGRSESRKCRKVYGMDNKDLWCTQCKWKKACSRFTE